MPIVILVGTKEEAVKSVERKISGSYGAGGTDSEALHGWLLKFGEYSTRLHTIVETFVDWLANRSPPSAAYHAFMSVRMIALDKQAGVHPVGVGETRRRIFSKIVLKVTGPEATLAFQDDQMCDRLKSGIDGAVHGVQTFWDKNLTTEDRGLLLVYAKDAFININQVRILWTVRHLWLYGARFFFN